MAFVTSNHYLIVCIYRSAFGTKLYSNSKAFDRIVDINIIDNEYNLEIHVLSLKKENVFFYCLKFQHVSKKRTSKFNYCQFVLFYWNDYLFFLNQFIYANN